MFYLFLIACLIICLLVVLMFFILRKTVKTINTQTRLYFVDKSSEYDDLINKKIEKLNEIDREIKQKELYREDANDYLNKDNYKFDFNIIDLFNSTSYQNNNVFELSKKLDDEFNFDYVSLINDFIKNVGDDSNYVFCVDMRNKLTSDVIYSLKTLDKDSLINMLKKIFNDNEYLIYKMYIDINANSNIDDFINYLNNLVDLNDPNIIVYVGDKNTNYDYLSKYVKTIYSNDIYKGIKIMYKSKIYDFSLNERNV